MADDKFNCYFIKLYGVEREISNKLFNSLSIYNNLSNISIVSLEENNKIIMMIKDFGHATTIELTINEKDIMVKYFIPKICNIEMINNLREINKVKIDADIFSSVGGEFSFSKENV